jgi:hypothetical protein
LIFISYYKDAEIKPCVVHDNPRQTLFGVFAWDLATLNKRFLINMLMKQGSYTILIGSGFEIRLEGIV